MFLIWPYSQWSFVNRTSILTGLARTVWEDPEWFFCVFVPPLVGFLIWRKRQDLARLPMVGEWWGLGLILAGGVCYWIGYKVDTSYPGYAAAQLVSAGLIVLFGGKAWMRALMFPWIFLCFTWPLYPLEDRISFPLRMSMAKVSGVAIDLIGIDVVREGTALYSAPDAAAGLKQGEKFMLDVDAPCAGMRSLFALIMISVIYAYMALRGIKWRVFLVLCSVPLAMLGNVARMVLLALGSELWGVEVAVGRNVDGVHEISAFHEIAGYVVFAVALGGMFAISSILERRISRRTVTAPAGSTSVADETADLKLRLLAAGGLVGLTLLMCGFIGGQPPLGAPGVKDKLPLKLGKVQGWEGAPDQRETNMLADDVKILRNYYLLPSGGNVACSVVLSGGERRSLHRPEVCLPAQGWNVTDKSRLSLQLANGRKVEAMLVRMLRDYAGPDGKPMRMKALNVFFYAGSEGVTTPDYYDHVLLSYLHALTRNLNHRWALVSFYMPYSEAELGKADPMAELGAMEDLRQFASEAAMEILQPLVD
jgi:exosortase